MAEVYSECLNCGFKDTDDEERGITNNGTGVASWAELRKKQLEANQ